jgi:hypothetical protein
MYAECRQLAYSIDTCCNINILLDLVSSIPVYNLFQDFKQSILDVFCLSLQGFGCSNTQSMQLGRKQHKLLPFGDSPFLQLNLHPLIMQHTINYVD